MAPHPLIRIIATLLLVVLFGFALLGQLVLNPPPKPAGCLPPAPGSIGPGEFDFDEFGPGELDGPDMFGGPGPGEFREIRLAAESDMDGDGRLNVAERQAARAKLASNDARRGNGPGGSDRPRLHGPSWRRDGQRPPAPGPKLSPADVKSFPGAPLYDPLTLRTFFLEFEAPDWEKELADFKQTDIDVPAKLTVDGRTYPDVGVHFHGLSSYLMVGEGLKRSLVLTLDRVHPNQQLEGYRKLILLNSFRDPSYLRTVLAFEIARDYMPAPKANFARVVINGESWGIYINQQAFNKDFLRDWIGTTQGVRWKLPGNLFPVPGFVYLGDAPWAYKPIYEIKSQDAPEPWHDLIKLCRTLNQSPAHQLELDLDPLLNIDGALKFLAWDNLLAGSDGFWARNSDCNLFEDKTGRFHIIPYDANGTFCLDDRQPQAGRPSKRRRPGPPPDDGMSGPDGPPEPPDDGVAEPDEPPDPPDDEFFEDGPGEPEGPPRGGPPGGPMLGGVHLDPLVAVTDTHNPLIARLLAVPALRARYLEYQRQMCQQWLNWNKLGPLARQYNALIDSDVKNDTRKLDSYEKFSLSIAEQPVEQDWEPDPDQPDDCSPSLKLFVEKRRAFLMQYKAPPMPGQETYSIARAPDTEKKTSMAIRTNNDQAIAE